VKFSVTGTYGCAPKGEDDVYTVTEFMEFVNDDFLTDCDGFGNPVKDNMADTLIWIIPSRCPTCIPTDATHIVWYNK
jgi:hypothetical protein